LVPDKESSFKTAPAMGIGGKKPRGPDLDTSRRSLPAQDGNNGAIHTTISCMKDGR
jgi:hypothetical protein